jgi:hypothetical protein
MFKPRHEQVSHAFSLPLQAEAALKLFTPEGERLWIKEWDPQYFHPETGETKEGMVFTTGDGDTLTYWTMVDFDLKRQQVRYVRLTPGSRSTIVHVSCTPSGAGECDVNVTYTLTGLSCAGNDFIEGFVGEAYTKMIESWRVLILDHIQVQ